MTGWCSRYNMWLTSRLLPLSSHCTNHPQCSHGPTLTSVILSLLKLFYIFFCTFFTGFDIHVSTHRDKFLIIKPTICTNFSNLFWKETLHVSGSSSIHHQEFFTVHTAVIQGVPLATEPGISLITLPVMRILQWNLKRTYLIVWEIIHNERTPVQISLQCLRWC